MFRSTMFITVAALLIAGSAPGGEPGSPLELVLAFRRAPDQTTLNQTSWGARKGDEVEEKGVSYLLVGGRIHRESNPGGIRGFYCDAGMAFADESTSSRMGYGYGEDRAYLSTSEFYREWGPYLGAGILMDRFRIGLRYYRGFIDIEAELETRGVHSESATLAQRSTYALEAGADFFGFVTLVVEGLRTDVKFKPDGKIYQGWVEGGESSPISWTQLLGDEISWAVRLELNVMALMKE
ncbi:MAG: hypothetical protein AB7V45_10200 [Candidatus Krumholzibacteriia bacterium]